MERSFKTIQPRHADVHDDQVWFQLASFFDGILPINGFASDLSSCLIGEKRTHTAPNDFVIVNYQQAHPQPQERVWEELNTPTKTRTSALMLPDLGKMAYTTKFVRRAGESECGYETAGLATRAQKPSCAIRVTLQRFPESRPHVEEPKPLHASRRNSTLF